MNLTFLGTGHGVPASDRYCSSYMLEVENNIYIIDTGAPVTDLLLRKGKKFENIKAIFNTHFHGDHSLGMIHLLDLCSWYYKDTAFTTFISEERATKAIVEVIEATSTVFAKDRLKFNVFSEGAIYDDGVIK